MKYEWKKAEKHIYLPKNTPEFIDVPGYNFFTIKEAGNPNAAEFSDYIGVLYSLSYAVKMSPKKNIAPAESFEYSVYPLEGIWDINEEAKKVFDGTLNKDDLVFKLMIRQPDFVDQAFARKIIEITKEKKPHQLLDKVKFEHIADGPCIQMMHLGSYESEPESFRIMEDFATKSGLTRKSKIHREIYISDARRVAPEKLRTVLRFKVLTSTK